MSASGPPLAASFHQSSRREPARIASAATLMALCSFMAFVGTGMSRETGALKLVPLKAMDRVERTGSLKSGPPIRLTGAMRETEPFQFAVAARGSSLDGVRVAASDLIGNGGARISKAAIQIFREHEIAFEIGSPGAPMPPGSYFDALIPIHDPYTGRDPDDVPYDGQPFSVPAGSNQPIWVDVRIPMDALAGNYKGILGSPRTTESRDCSIGRPHTGRRARTLGPTPAPMTGDTSVKANSSTPERSRQLDSTALSHRCGSNGFARGSMTTTMSRC